MEGARNRDRSGCSIGGIENLRASFAHGTSGFSALSRLSGGLSENFASSLRVERWSHCLLWSEGFSLDPQECLNAVHSPLEEGGSKQIDPKESAEYQHDGEEQWQESRRRIPSGGRRSDRAKRGFTERCRLIRLGRDRM